MLKLLFESFPTSPMKPRNASRPLYTPERGLWPGAIQTRSSAQYSLIRSRSPEPSASYALPTSSGVTCVVAVSVIAPSVPDPLRDRLELRDGPEEVVRAVLVAHVDLDLGDLAVA